MQIELPQDFYDYIVKGSSGKTEDLIREYYLKKTAGLKITAEDREASEKKELKLQFLSLVSGRNPMVAEATELIVTYILSHNYIYTTRDDLKSEMWIYTNGIYEPQGRSIVKEIMRDILQESFNAHYCNLVLNKIEADTFINSDTFFNTNHITEVPVKNGILNILTKQINPFDPKKIFFNKLPVEYNPMAQCPQIDKFLTDILPYNEDKEVYYEVGGNCLYREHKFEKAFMFVGNGRNGKDKSLELIKRVIGIENICSVPLASIQPDSFIISEFFGKMANIAGDINSHDLKDTSMFKALTGRSIVSGQRKFLKPITFVNSAKFIFACNELPMVYDNSKGFWDRWVLLEFPYTFVIKEDYDFATDKNNLKLRDEEIIDKITTPQELSGLLNKFLEGLARLIKNKRFSITQGSEEIKNFWIRKSNSVVAFCSECIKPDYDSYITKKEFRRRYAEFCKTYKLSVKSDYVIKRTLEEFNGTIEGNKEVMGTWDKVWEGITWK